MAATLDSAPYMLDISLHNALKEATHEQHEALHQHPLLKGLATGKISRLQWLKALQAFYCFYRVYEPAMQNYAQFEQAPVMQWLEQDLQNLALNIPSEINSFPLVQIDDISKAVGYLYVKQGSTLGGQVISKKLRHSLGLEAGKEQMFFYGYGSETGKKWKLFLSQISEIENNIDREVTINTARLLFTHLASICDSVCQQDNTCLRAN
ncbi:MAG: biliverdin-producing heme oxygenase [Alphaproteobacteria bacterium]|nr:biliverdin-producing heme oxygenase [Alphaproteobacteria bacterium]